MRISLPVFLAAFIPQRMLSKVNDYLTEHPHAGKTLEEFEGCKSEEEPNLEVYVHVTETGGGAMGHVDVGFKGKVISYGNYDESSATWAYGKGDGVMLFTEREKYLPFCVSHSGDTIFSFGLKLSDDQIDRVHKRISEIMMETIPWDSPYDADKKAGKDAGKIQYKDYASCLAQVSDTEFYKFKRGRWKSYFVLSTNCVLLADNILSSAGTDILKMNGIVTPGVYYDYLEHEFERTDGVVITRAIFRPEKKEADAPSPPEFGKGKGKKKGR